MLLFFTKYHVKKLMAFTILFVCCVIFYAKAVEKELVPVEEITPQQIYAMAQERDGRTMAIIRDRIDVKDENGNTALCLAQRDKDKESFKMLLVFGASKDVDCYDETDPVCAIIVGEKWRVNGAGWLLGAAAAGGAIYGVNELLDDSSCPKGYNKRIRDVSSCGVHPEGWIYEQHPKHEKCGKCAPKMYDTGCTTLWQNVNDCGEHPEGWNFASSGYAGDEVCGICSPKQCSRRDTTSIRGADIRYTSIEYCPHRAHMVPVSQEQDGWSGVHGCYVCNYACDEKTGFAAENTCQTNQSGNIGYECAQDSDTRCYIRVKSLQCPVFHDDPKILGSSTHYGNTESCPARIGMALTNVSQKGWSGDQGCYTCNYACDEKTGFTAENTCQTNQSGNIGYECAQDSDTRCYIRVKSLQCPVFHDDPKILGSSTHYGNTESCPARIGMALTNVSQKGWSGDQGCYTCNYACDEKTGFTAETDCAQNGAGAVAYGCVRDEKTGCFSRSETFSCPIVNSSAQQGSNPGYKELINCPARRFMVAESVSPNGWAGETECYNCNYKCDEKNGFANQTSCENNDNGGSGYVCQRDAATQCYYRSRTPNPANPDGGEKGCPANYSTAYQSAGNCVALGGTENGWLWSQNGWSGELKCGKCDANKCAEGNALYQTNEDCPTVAYRKVYGRELKGWAGDKGCYTCLYQCDSEQDSYDSNRICEAFGLTCEAVDNADGSKCWIIKEGCPEGYTSQIQEGQEEKCGTSGALGWSLESNGVSNSGKTCNKCVAKVCAPPDTDDVQDASACGFSGEKGWHLIPATDSLGNEKFEGVQGGIDRQCKKCEALEYCKIANTVTEDACVSSEGISAEWTRDYESYMGDTPCGVCTKTCAVNGTKYFNSKIECDNKIVDVDDVQCVKVEGTTNECYAIENITCPEQFTRTEYTDKSDCPIYKTVTEFSPNLGNQVTMETGYKFADGTQCTKCSFDCVPIKNHITGESHLVSTSNYCPASKGWHHYYIQQNCYWCALVHCSADHDIGLTANDCVNDKGGNINSWKIVEIEGEYSGGIGCQACTAVPCNTQGARVGAGNCEIERKEQTGLVAGKPIENVFTGSTQCTLCECANPSLTAESDCPGGGKAKLSVNSYGVENCYHCPTAVSRMLSDAWEKVNNQTLIIRHEEGDYRGDTTVNAKASAPMVDELTGELSGGDAVGSITLYNSASNAEVALQYGNKRTLYNAQANGEGAKTQVSAEGSLKLIMEKGAENVVASGMSSGTDAYNAYAAANARALGVIDIQDTEAATNVIYGIQARRNAHNAFVDGENAFASGHINIRTATDIAAYGMYAGGDIYNQSSSNQKSIVNVAGTGAGNLYGLYSEAGSVYNSGDVNVHAANGNAYGIYVGNGAGQIVDNSGNIIVASDAKTAYGIYVANGGDTGNGVTVINSGLIDAAGDSDSRGIKIAANGANATIRNTGRIIVNGSENNIDTAIDLNGATLANSGEVEFKGRQNLNALNGRVAIEKGGSYKAGALSGDIHIGQSVIQEGFKDRYTAENAVQAQNDGLNVISDSAMFKGSLAANGKGGYDAVADRRDFNEFAPNQSIADYLEENYKRQRLAELYGELKSAETDERLSADILSETGADTLVNMPQENLNALRHASETIVESVLTPTEEINRVMSGADVYFMDAEGRGGASGYETNAATAFMYGDKRLNNKNRVGLGLAFMQLNTSYDNGGNHDENFISIFLPWLHNFSDKLRLASILSAGWGYGDYDRGDNRDAHINDFVYGLTNKLVYSVNLADFAELEPALVLNAIGYYQDEMDEGKLVVKGGNHLSVEAGVGAYLKKELLSGKYGKLTARLGGMYYHELADPYNRIRAGFKGGVGSYSINDFADIYSRDRAVLSAMLDYEYKRLALYLKYHQLLQRNKAQNFDMGVRYNF